MDKDKIIAQYNADAGLMDKFEQSGVYARSVLYALRCCIWIAIEEPISSKSFILKGLIGIDTKSLFLPASGVSLAKVATSREIMMLNLFWVYSRSTPKLVLCYITSD
ncbi:hypothetical protein V6N11_028734 [Hibiscus sabdariffa]|uniref:Uncharacterized protein n=1 Tax=Hibiscus sabdariffa TaxID=183260 RepID=A0ABR2PQP1_9ROSI